MPGLSHDQIISMGLDENNLPSGYFRTDGGSGYGSLGETESSLNAATDRYINDLLASVNGDRDFAIKKLTQEHDLAISNNDPQTAKFLETVASDLEPKIGRIPYDYKVAVERTEDKTKTILDRLMEDEKVWMKENDQSNKEARVSQQESLAQRGILSGTRDEAKGLAGSEVKTLEQKMQEKLDTYARAKGRNVADVNTDKRITLEDLATGARRGVQDVQMATSLGKESANRIADAKAKELERQRELDKKANKAYTPQVYYGQV
jgi:hypothetical protein